MGEKGLDGAPEHLFRLRDIEGLHETPGVVRPDYAIDFWSPLVPELGLRAALEGMPDD